MINPENDRSQPKSDDIIAQIKSLLNFKDFFLELYPDVKLKRSGVGRWIGSSPFREDKKPSLLVTKDHCFDFVTEETMDCFDLYELHFQVNRNTAISALSKRVGIISNNGGRPKGKKSSPPCTLVSIAPKTDIQSKNKPTPKYADLKDVPFDEKYYKQTIDESVTSYLHNTPDGKPHIRVFRKHIGENKVFQPWTWNGEYYVLGCPEDTPRYLYGIERVKDADVVIVVEGEKDVDNINRLLGDDPKIMAVTWAGGAASLEGQCKKWDILGPLAGKDVYFIPDLDEPGETAFSHALKYLFGRVDELRRVILPGLGEHGDASDYLELHKDDPNLRDLFLQTCMEAPLYLPDCDIKDILYRADTMGNLSWPVPEEIVKGLIPVGLAIVGGKNKARKSILCQQLALAVANGSKALGYFETTEGSALHCSLEDDGPGWYERLSKMLIGEHGSDPAPAKLYASFNITPLPNLIEQIETWKRQIPDLKLLVLDILDFILGPANKGKLRGAASGGYHDWYDILNPLKRLAKNLGIAIVVVHHEKKGQSDDDFDGLMGSGALGGVCDCQVSIKKEFKKEYQGTLKCQGRRIRDMKPLALKFYPESFTLNVIGELDDCAMSEGQKNVIAKLQTDAPKPVKLKTLFDQCHGDMDYDAFRQMVQRMKTNGMIVSGATQGTYTMAATHC